jgi:hypothetical protein
MSGRVEAGRVTRHFRGSEAKRKEQDPYLPVALQPDPASICAKSLVIE